MSKLTPEGEVIASYGAAMVAAFQVLINCLEESDSLLPGQFPEALRVYREMTKSQAGDVSDMTGKLPTRPAFSFWCISRSAFAAWSGSEACLSTGAGSNFLAMIVHSRRQIAL